MKKIFEETESFSTAEEYAHHMIDILKDINEIQGIPACYNPKPYLKIIKKAIKVGKLAINKFENSGNLKKDDEE